MLLDCPRIAGPTTDHVGFGYRGELHTGALVHLRARDYHPATGTFLSTDPLDGIPGTTTLANPYHYAHNNPLAYVDPLGLTPLTDGELNSFWTDQNGDNIIACSLQAWGVGVTFGIIGDRHCDNSIYDASAVIGAGTTIAAGSAAAAYMTGTVTAQTCITHCNKTPSATSVVLLNSSKQLQSKFGHAADFGVTGNYSKANAAKFSAALNQHVNRSSVTKIAGTYRGNPVTHYLDRSTGLNVIVDPSGTFVSGWRLGPEQLMNVLKHGGLQ